MIYPSRNLNQHYNTFNKILRAKCVVVNFAKRPYRNYYKYITPYIAHFHIPIYSEMIIIINYIASLSLYLVQWLIECNCYALGTIFKKKLCACHINTKNKNA